MAEAGKCGYHRCMGNIGPLEIVGLLLLALLLFGAKRLPEIGRSLGHGMREFKDSVSGNSPPPEPEQPQIHQAIASPPSEVTTPAASSERESV